MRPRRWLLSALACSSVTRWIRRSSRVICWRSSTKRCSLPMSRFGCAKLHQTDNTSLLGSALLLLARDGARRSRISLWSLVQSTGLAPPLLPRPTRGFSVDRSSVSRPRTLRFASCMTAWTTGAHTADRYCWQEKEWGHGCAVSWNGSKGHDGCAWLTTYTVTAPAPSHCRNL